MSHSVRGLRGLEILDSRGRPTVLARCELASGAVGQASVPSGASRGAAEAWELRDGDMARHRGLGCRRAAANIGGEIAAALAGRELSGQAELDRILTELDGTPNLARLGANAALGVSLAFARACAAAEGRPLYAYAAELAGVAPRLPRPMINLFSGGKHAGGQVPVQDLLIMPMAPGMAGVMEQATAVFQCAAEIMAERYDMRLLTADEGGLAPPFPALKAMFEDALAAIERAGLRPGEEVRLAIDVAASHFYDGERSLYQLGECLYDGPALIEQLARWVADYGLISVEDGLAEDDWEHWPQLVARLGSAQVVGDDLLCTNPARIARAAREGAANALLLKVNQIGTLSEALEANRLARAAGWRVVVSARSGETEDAWLADLAVGWAGDQIKIGSVTQSERLAKYNRLLEIEAWDGLDLP
jgi:enolase